MLAGKHVLCEKPVSSNAAELRSLLAIAKEKNLFFMEALWTRFHPLAKDVKSVAEEGSLGDPVVLHADLSGDFDIESMLIYKLVQISALNREHTCVQIFQRLTAFWIQLWVEEDCSICKCQHVLSIELYSNISKEDPTHLYG